MKKVMLVLLVLVLSSGMAFANKNPKLLKEIKRKVTLDLSKVELKKNSKEFVIVKFNVTNSKVNIIEIEGSMDELTDLMMDELKEMVIQTDIIDNTTYTYKFNFEKE